MEPSALSSQAAEDSTLASTTQASRSSGQQRTTRQLEPSSNATGLPSLLPKTCERSTPDSLLSMFSPAGFPARISAKLAFVLDSLSEPDPASGTSSLAPFAYFDRESSSWRTSQASLLPDSESLPPTWSRQGMWGGGAASELPTSVRLMDDSESSSLLPTPSAYESTPTENFTDEVRDSLADPHKRLYLPGRKWHAQRTLSRMASALLPTPTGDDANNVTRESGDFQSLAREANKLLPTPVVTDSYGSRRSTARTEDWISNPGTSLTDAIWETQGRETDTKGNLLPTPSSRDRKGKSARNPSRSDNGKPRTDRERPLSDIDQLTGASTPAQSKGGKNSLDPLPGQLTIEDV